MKFCKVWRTRQEIQKEFSLSPVESWHLVKFIRKLPADFQFEKKTGYTRRAEMYRTRKYVLDGMDS